MAQRNDERRRRLFWRLPALAMLAATAAAQTAAAPGDNSASSGATREIAVLRASLIGNLDARKMHGGEPIQASVAQEVTVGHATIAKGATILGHLGQVRRRAKGEDSVLELVFDRVRLKDGSELPLLVSVQAIGPTAPSNEEASVAGSSAEATDRSGCVPGMDAVRSSMGRTAGNASGGQLALTSVGIVEIPDLALTRYARGDTLISQVTCAKRDVRLEGGSQLILRVGLR